MACPWLPLFLREGEIGVIPAAGVLIEIGRFQRLGSDCRVLFSTVEPRPIYQILNQRLRN